MNNRPWKGLTETDIRINRESHGTNALSGTDDRVLRTVLREIVTEPMFVLLLLACILYFAVGQTQEGVIMLVSLLIVAGISLFQEYRSRNAVAALNKLSATRARVIRNGGEIRIDADELVYGDILLLEEGEIIPADGLVLSSNDFSVNESILTGEAFAVFKSAQDKSTVYRGTLITSGSAVVEVNAVGLQTLFGKIGGSLRAITVIKTPLQLQIRSFVRNMVWIGAAAFVVVVAWHYIRTGQLLSSFMQGLTLAMSILPEEIPVAFSTFQALGAFRLLRNHIIVKQPQYVETLGAATVICTDKTGTLTQNRMDIAFLYDAPSGQEISPDNTDAIPLRLLEYAMWSSETNPFDPMEKSIHALYAARAPKDLRPAFEQIHEYPIGGKPPMMTHIFRNPEGAFVIAAKGSPEAILRQSSLPIAKLKQVEEKALAYAARGYRVLGVGAGSWMGKQWPVSQEEFSFEFLGLLVFFDPPKENIRETVQALHEAGIRLTMITGDYASTALAIAREAGLRHNGKVLTGEEIVRMPKETLQEAVKNADIYARMFPEAKLKVVDALKENGEVVAMTGDGVNDAPSLKAAHIGIAMGKRGSEVARSAASMVLTDDDLAHMTEAVAMGRKIYDNLRKAIRYIVSIHIPIILVVMLPLLLGWPYTGIFSPVHVIFMELIMGPTCSIIYENEPMEAGTMQRPPRPANAGFLSLRQLSISIIQGLVITAGCLGNGYLYLQSGSDESKVRTIIFITLLFANIFLTFVNRSFRFTFFTTFRYHNPLLPLISGITLAFIAIILWIPAARDLFRLTALTPQELLVCITMALLATCWLEPFKRFLKA